MRRGVSREVATSNNIAEMKFDQSTKLYYQSVHSLALFPRSKVYENGHCNENDDENGYGER